MRETKQKPRLIVIVGPTCAGKTEIAVNLARRWGGEIISADSMQVYRFMDIGTAKPTLEDRNIAKHHLVDVVNPDETFNAAMFIEHARGIISTLHDQRKPIFVVGGTGLYVKVLFGGLLDGPGADENLRNFYREKLRMYGNSYLYEKLKQRDERAAGQIKPNDAVRIIRALEVLELSGTSIIEKQGAHCFRERRYERLQIGLTVERPRLFDRIEQRTEKMVKNGLVDEVCKLLDMGYHEQLKPMRTFGYKYIVKYLKGLCDIKEAKRLINRDTKHYAKRQMTWFGADNNIEWFSPGDISIMERRIQGFLLP
jgi:tRNA dimethylallyltransferase